MAALGIAYRYRISSVDLFYPTDAGYATDPMYARLLEAKAMARLLKLEALSPIAPDQTKLPDRYNLTKIDF